MGRIHTRLAPRRGNNGRSAMIALLLPPPSTRWRPDVWNDWQAQAKAHIAKFMADVPASATWQERQKILRENAWQFTGGTSWGKKVWAKHCKAYLAMHGKPMPAKEAAAKAPLFAPDIIFPFRPTHKGEGR